MFNRINVDLTIYKKMMTRNHIRLCVTQRLDCMLLTKSKTLIRNNTTTGDAKSHQVPNPKKISTDMVGPPDPVSNLRKVVYKETNTETDIEKRYRKLRMETQKWNDHFWSQHNTRFFEEREEYLKKNLPEGKQNLTADEMSVFYKIFLDKNWQTHKTYNVEWYKKNFLLLSLAIQVRLRKLFGNKNPS